MAEPKAEPRPRWYIVCEPPDQNVYGPLTYQRALNELLRIKRDQDRGFVTCPVEHSLSTTDPRETLDSRPLGSEDSEEGG